MATDDPNTRAAGVRDQEVAITGRLASMSRAEAVARIERAGGRYVLRPRAGTDLLVVGQLGWPLRRDGRVTKSLDRAQRLREAGSALAIIDEGALLGRLGLTPASDGLYPLARVAEMLEVPPARVRDWVRRALLLPRWQHGRLLLFDFTQVAAARTLLRLLGAGVGVAELRRSLAQLRRWLPQDTTLAQQLACLEKGDELLVRLADGRLAEPGGQLRLDFDPAHRPPPIPFAAGGGGGDPLDAFEAGLRRERAGDLEAALAAYETALAGIGPEPEVLFNIGNVLLALGRPADAAARFLQAVELDADFAEAWNNLGSALTQAGLDDDGIHAFRRALAVAPDYADAHFNLADVLYRRGRRAEAKRHWRAYLQRDPLSPWARTARERLAEE